MQVPPWLSLTAAATSPATWTWGRAAEAGVKIGVLVIITFLVRFAAHRAIDRLVRRAAAEPDHQPLRVNSRIANRTRQWRPERQTQRSQAIGSLLKSSVTVLLAAVFVFMALGLLGYALGPILASAGVVGVALGFGAQNLVKDFLAGVAMILEDQFGIGDVVDLNLASGTVEAIGLRVTRLRDATGAVWYVRNGEVLRVGNKSQGWSQISLDVQIAYDEDVERATSLVNQVVAEVVAEPDYASTIIDAPSVVGVEQVTGAAVTLKVLGTCQTNQNYAIQREIRRRLKETFDRSGVRVPPPIPIWGADRSGAATPP